MTMYAGQPPFFDYSKKYFTEINKVYLTFGNDITIASNHYCKVKKYNRRYIFNYNNSAFVLHNITQCPRRLDIIWSEAILTPERYYKHTGITDVANMNNLMDNHINPVVNNSDPILNQLPDVINNQLLNSIFNFPNSNYRYFLDFNFMKSSSRISAHEDYYHEPFNIKQYRMSLLRYGLLNQNNQIILLKDRRKSQSIY